jgi:hypothetical protein
VSNVDLLDRILNQLGEVRVRCPELRFGQLIATIGMLAEDETGHSLWDVEDASFAAAVEQFARDMARRGSNRAESALTPDDRSTSSSAESTSLQQPRQGS